MYTFLIDMTNDCFHFARVLDIQSLFILFGIFDVSRRSGPTRDTVPSKIGNEFAAFDSSHRFWCGIFPAILWFVRILIIVHIFACPWIPKNVVNTFFFLGWYEKTNNQHLCWQQDNFQVDPIYQRKFHWQKRTMRLESIRNRRYSSTSIDSMRMRMNVLKYSSIQLKCYKWIPTYAQVNRSHHNLISHTNRIIVDTKLNGSIRIRHEIWLFFFLLLSAGILLLRDYLLNRPFHCFPSR